LVGVHHPDSIVIDSEGRLGPTRLTESVQLQVYHDVTPGPRYLIYSNAPSRRDQDFFEISHEWQF